MKEEFKEVLKEYNKEKTKEFNHKFFTFFFIVGWIIAPIGLLLNNFGISIYGLMLLIACYIVLNEDDKK